MAGLSPSGRRRRGNRRASVPPRLLLWAFALALAACGAPVAGPTAADDPARSAARHDGYVLNLVVASWGELGGAAPAGTLGDLGYRVDIAGPGAALVDVEMFVIRGRSATHYYLARVAYRREPGAAADAPLGRLVGGIALPAEARPGDHLRLLATALLPGGWLPGKADIWLRLEAGSDGALRATPVRPTPAPPTGDEDEGPTANPPTVAPSAIPGAAASARATRSVGAGAGDGAPTREATVVPRAQRLMAPEPAWSPRPTPLTEAEVVAFAAATLPPALYARARVAVERGPEAGRWTVHFAGLDARLSDLGWPDAGWPGATPTPDDTRAASTIERVAVEVDAATGQPLVARAFAGSARP